MESNGVRSIFVGWAMSITSKRAKERQNQSSDELVMAETKYGQTRETLKPTTYGHTYGRFSKHKEIHDPNPTRDDTKGSRFFW